MYQYLHVQQAHSIDDCYMICYCDTTYHINRWCSGTVGVHRFGDVPADLQLEVQHHRIGEVCVCVHVAGCIQDSLVPHVCSVTGTWMESHVWYGNGWLVMYLHVHVALTQSKIYMQGPLKLNLRGGNKACMGARLSSYHSIALDFGVKTGSRSTDSFQTNYGGRV